MIDNNIFFEKRKQLRYKPAALALLNIFEQNIHETLFENNTFTICLKGKRARSSEISLFVNIRISFVILQQKLSCNLRTTVTKEQVEKV